MKVSSRTFGSAWQTLLMDLYYSGRRAAPRGQGISEFIGTTLHVTDGRANVLVSPIRKPSYRFMIAEWLWIWFGHEDVATIATYNKHIAAFSDNGVTFSGAYGPKVATQWPLVLGTLRRDLDSRQAIIQIFDRPTGPTKDLPCTLALQFLVRERIVHVIVTMRSSDIWLGLPYDFFNFSMLGNILAAQLNLTLGSVTMHLGSSHLYDRDKEMAGNVLHSIEAAQTIVSPQLPSEPPEELDRLLQDYTMVELVGKLGEPWDSYALVLGAKNSVALEILQKLQP
jgi:Thymidylate synthase